MESDLSQIYYFPTHSPQMPYYFLILQQLVLLLNLYGEANELKILSKHPFLQTKKAVSQKENGPFNISKILLPLRNDVRGSTRPPYREHHFDVWRWR